MGDRGVRPQPVERRFLSHVDVRSDDECWLWTGSSSNGYGTFSPRDGTIIKAHVLAYYMWRGDYSSGLDLDHLCRNHACVNPNHLEPVTRLVNLARSPLTNIGKSHCVRCGETLRIRKNGTRVCASCQSARLRHRYKTDPAYRASRVASSTKTRNATR